MQQFKFNVSSLRKNSLWKLSKREFGQFKRQYGNDLTYKDFQIQLDGLFVYFLNDFGLTVNPDGTLVDKNSARYILAQINQTHENEPLYAWMYQKGNGIFSNITFGTRIEFDKYIATKSGNDKCLI